jgi:hypothetical protein
MSTCPAMFEGVPAHRSRTTHTCMRDADHGDEWHLCPTCAAYWKPSGSGPGGSVLRPGDAAWWSLMLADRERLAEPVHLPREAP